MSKKPRLRRDRPRSWAIWLIALLATFTGLTYVAVAWAGEERETRISGQMRGADSGNPLAGAILLEKGRLYGKNYQYGGLVDENGYFSIKVKEGGDYGLHLYATGYIYFPLGINIKGGQDNKFAFTLPPNKALKDAPVISKVVFEKVAQDPNRMVIKLSVQDPNHNLSHQVLGANIRTQEGFIFPPPSLVFPWTCIYPDGVYTLEYDTRGRPFDPREWLFVAANNRCYNSPVLRYPFTQEGIIPAASQAGPAPSAPLQGEALGPEALLDLGRRVFASNCAICHYPDKTETKVGPGLQGLFQRRLTPGRGIPVTEANIRHQIEKGSEKMPPYDFIKGRELEALLVYLRTL